MIVGVLNQKGGVGKTTLATHIAGEWASQGRSITLIDADPQGSAIDWARTRERSGLLASFEVIGMAKDSLHEEVPAIAGDRDHILIDGPPRITALARSTILASDMVLIPVQPSSYDVWASADIVRLIGEAKAFKPGLTAAFVVNRCIVGTVIGRDVRDALVGSVPALRSIVSQRVAFAESVATGQLVREIDRGGPAAREITALAAEIMEAA